MTELRQEVINSAQSHGTEAERWKGRNVGNGDVW
jgi:hypothetical protein